MTSGTLSVVAYLRFGHPKGRDAIVGEPREKGWDRKAGKSGRCSCRKAPQLEELHRRRQANFIAKPLGVTFNARNISSGTSRIT